VWQAKVDMNKFVMIRKKLLLSENARLFDTKEYVLKSFIAVVIAGIVGKNIPYVNKDMISLLFGMMLTLEPSNIAGVRSGLSQIKATVIGALVTGLVLMIGGYSIISMAIGITLTIYVCMLINWREVMVVAMFTAIYMTQYVQLDAMGHESELETIKLRLAALGSGIIIAFLVNFVFSIFGYRRMVNKRIYYVSKELCDVSMQIRQALVKNDQEQIVQIMNNLPDLFNTIDWITNTLVDVKKDQQRFKIIYSHFNADEFIQYSKTLRGITHVLYDLCHRVSMNPAPYMELDFIQSFEERQGYFEAVKEAFNHNKTIPRAKWKPTTYSWLNHYSKVLEQLNPKL